MIKIYYCYVDLCVWCPYCGYGDVMSIILCILKKFSVYLCVIIFLIDCQQEAPPEQLGHYLGASSMSANRGSDEETKDTKSKKSNMIYLYKPGVDTTKTKNHSASKATSINLTAIDPCHIKFSYNKFNL